MIRNHTQLTFWTRGLQARSFAFSAIRYSSSVRGEKTREVSSVNFPCGRVRRLPPRHDEQRDLPDVALCPLGAHPKGKKERERECGVAGRRRRNRRACEIDRREKDHISQQHLRNLSNTSWPRTMSQLVPGERSWTGRGDVHATRPE